MAELTNAEIDSAVAQGRSAREHEPRAATARYDRGGDRIIVELTNGCTFAFPPRLAQGLGSATADQLAQVEVLGVGYGLHWEALDVDLSVPGLMAGLFGTQAFIAGRPGRARGPAKTSAKQRDGAKDRTRRQAGD
jgi:hypothetical protein